LDSLRLGERKIPKEDGSCENKKGGGPSKRENSKRGKKSTRKSNRSLRSVEQKRKEEKGHDGGREDSDDEATSQFF